MQGVDISILKAPDLLLAHAHLGGVQLRPSRDNLECTTITARVANNIILLLKRYSYSKS